MATYAQIQAYVKQEHGYTPKTCWITHMKEKSGLPVTRAHNRQSEVRLLPCPESKEDSILEAFRHYGLLK